MTTDTKERPINLPALPPIDAAAAIGYSAMRYVNGYTEYFVKRYAQAYASAAVEADRAALVPLTDGQAKSVLWEEHLRWLEAAGSDTEGMRPTGEWLDHWLTYVRAIEAAHGIGGTHDR